MLNSSIRSFFLWGAIFLALSGCASKSQRANEAYTNAQQYMTYNNLVDARRELLRAVSIRDDLPDIWFALGQVRLAGGELPEAFTAFTRADELRPGDANTLRPLAYAGYMIGATRLAQDATDRLLILAPADGQGLAVKGLLALDKGDTTTALAASEAILSSTPNDDTGLMLKARAMAVAGKVDDGISLLQNGLKSAGPQSGLTMSLLQFYRAKGDVAGMQGLFPSLVAQQKNNFDLALDFTNFLYRTGNVELARKVWSDAVVANRGDGRFIAWAFDLYDNFEPFDKPVALDPRIMRIGKSPLRSATGAYLIVRNEFGRAAAVLAQGGDVADADRGLYAMALEGLGKHAEARAIVDQILSADTGRQDPNALILRAQTAIAAKSFDRANTDAQTAIIADPSNLSARLVLAQSYLVSGQLLRARQVLAEAARELPHSRRALAAYLKLLQSVGDDISAVAAARAFADANPALPWSWEMVATACQRANDGGCVVVARGKASSAAHNFTFANPARPLKMRGLFSPLPAA